MSAPPPILWDVLEEHLDEAESLAETWALALDAPDWTLPELAAGPEARLLAHLDGLVLGGPAVVERLLLPCLTDPQAPPARITVAAWVALELGAIDQVWPAFLAAPPEQTPAWGRAVALGQLQVVLPKLPEALGPKLAGLIDGITQRAEAQDTLVADLLRRLEPEVHAATLALARHAAPPASGGYWERALGTPPGPIRAAAAELGLVLGDVGALGVARAEPALHGLLLQLGDADVWDRLPQHLLETKTPAPTWLAVGCAGRLTGAELALAHLRSPEHHATAAEAFQRITGIDWAQAEALVPSPPEPEEPPPLAEDLPYEALLPQALDALPKVDPDRVEVWWKGARGRFTPEGRYLLGRPIDSRQLQVALQEGPLRPRAAWARELLVRSQGAWSIPTHTFSGPQRAALARAPKGLILDRPWRGGR